MMENKFTYYRLACKKRKILSEKPNDEAIALIAKLTGKSQQNCKDLERTGDTFLFSTDAGEVDKIKEGFALVQKELIVSKIDVDVQEKLETHHLEMLMTRVRVPKSFVLNFSPFLHFPLVTLIGYRAPGFKRAKEEMEVFHHNDPDYYLDSFFSPKVSEEGLNETLATIKAFGLQKKRDFTLEILLDKSSSDHGELLLWVGDTLKAIPSEYIEKKFKITLPERLKHFYDEKENERYQSRLVKSLPHYEANAFIPVSFEISDVEVLFKNNLLKDVKIDQIKCVPFAELKEESQFLVVQLLDACPVYMWEHENGNFYKCADSLDNFLNENVV